MKALKVLALSVLLMLASVVPSHAMVIKKDNGGVIVDFLKKWVEVRRSSEKVIIDGECNSACTLFFGFLPDSQFCVTNNAWFGFHSATQISYKKGKETSEHASEFSALMFNMYPANVQEILQKNGWRGLNPHPDLISIKGDQIARKCTSDDISDISNQLTEATK